MKKRHLASSICNLLPWAGERREREQGAASHCNTKPWLIRGPLKLQESVHHTSHSGSSFSVCFMPELSGVSNTMTFKGNQWSFLTSAYPLYEPTVNSRVLHGVHLCPLTQSFSLTLNWQGQSGHCRKNWLLFMTWKSADKMALILLWESLLFRGSSQKVSQSRDSSSWNLDPATDAMPTSLMSTWHQLDSF